jgi:phasin
MNEFATAAIQSNEAFRETAEKGVAQVKDTYEKAKVATGQATDILKDTYATAAKGATEYNLKIIEIARINTNAAFEHAQQLLGVKSPSEFIELSTAHARKQFDTMIAQTKELTELGQKVTTKITEPLKAGVTTAFNKKVV